MKIIKLFLLSMALLGIYSTQAQNTYTLHGTVSGESGVIPGVAVDVLNSPKGVTTDFDGHYELKLTEGQYELLFSYGNEKKVTVDLSEDRVLDVDLGQVREELDEVFISAVQVDADSPITFSNLEKEEIEERNLGQDIPVLMDYMPSVTTTSDAGAGVGYTGLRVRGSDATRINVTINGVPVNDSESQNVFWVNLGDIASSVDNLQLQRGVGTSTNGAGAFGASINITTESYSEEPYAEISNSYGSFQTHKHNLKFSTGLFDEHFEFNGRASMIKSDGYIDRASSELKSYFLQGSYNDKNTQIKALLFGGKETTYQSWFGIGPERLENDRTYNPAGRYTDDEGNVNFYDKQTDNYRQDHAQLLWNQTYNRHWSSNVGFHYTYGRGYYQEYQEDAVLNAYGVDNFTAAGEEREESDLVNREWLKNNFYGTTFSVNYETNSLDAVVGGALNQYEGDHYGKVIYTRFAKNKDPHEPYYFNNADKTDFNIYGKATLSLTDDLAVYADMQYRRINYENEGVIEENKEFPIDTEFNFFNPKAGLTYELDRENQFYFSFAVAQREPNRTDFKNALESGNDYPDTELLNDYELGWRWQTDKSKINANLYYMKYRDQLVLTGDIDDVGAQIRENSGESYRLGLEVNADFQLTKNLSIKPNIALSQNKNLDFSSRIEGEKVNFGDTDIAFSPQIVAGNMIRYQPFENLQLNLLSKFVGDQYMSNTEAEDSKLDSYFKNDLNIQYTWNQAPWFESVVFTGLVNNIFDEKYVSNGFYSAAYGPGYYPQAGINYLAGVTLRF